MSECQKSKALRNLIQGEGHQIKKHKMVPSIIKLKYFYVRP